MSERLMRHVSDSRTIQHYMVMPGYTNARNVLFGGKLLSWIDELAGIVALRHCDASVLTVAIDHLEFKQSANISDIITLDGRVTWVGNTSLEVCVMTYRENKGAHKELINKAYVVLVCMADDDTGPQIAPGLLVETEEEKAEWLAGEKRNALRKQRKHENF